MKSLFKLLKTKFKEFQKKNLIIVKARIQLKLNEQCKTYAIQQ